VLGVPVLGDTGALIGHRIMPYVDRVIIAVNSTAQARVDQLVERLEVLPNPVSLFVDLNREASATPPWPTSSTCRARPPTPAAPSSSAPRTW
jgi:hypothetical protein